MTFPLNRRFSKIYTIIAHFLHYEVKGYVFDSENSTFEEKKVQIRTNFKA